MRTEVPGVNRWLRRRRRSGGWRERRQGRDRGSDDPFWREREGRGNAGSRICDATSVSRFAAPDLPSRNRLEKDAAGRLGKAWRNLGGAVGCSLVGSDSPWKVRLCGPLRFTQDGAGIEHALPGRQGRLLLAYLLLNRDRGCPRSELIDLLWPERPPAAADTALSALLSKLRRALGPDAIRGRSELRLVPPGAVEVDVEVAADATAVAAAALQAGDWTTAMARADRALEIDLPGFLPGTAVRWAAEQRREWEAVRQRALEIHAEAALRLGDLNAAETGARGVIAAAPFRESAHRLLMEVHEAAGNPAEALRAFEDLRMLLREELGTTPGAAAMEVHARLLRGEPAPVQAAGSVPPPVNPWPALLSAALDRHALVDREDELAALEQAWHRATEGERHLVTLAGDAGIGKTRLAAEVARS